MWSALGLGLSILVCIAATYKSKRGGGSFYANEVYGMTPKSHRAYAAVSALFAALFAVSFFVRVVPTVPLLAAYALVFLFYVSSFARGFSDEE